MELVQGKCEKHLVTIAGVQQPNPKVDFNGQSVCMLCEAEVTPKTGITVHTEDPGEEELRKVLAKSGIAVPPNTGKAPMADVPMPARPRTHASVNSIPQIQVFSAAPGKAVSLEDMVKQALGIMRALPMPNDMKQFKAIHKVIAGMEGLLGEK